MAVPVSVCTTGPNPLGSLEPVVTEEEGGGDFSMASFSAATVSSVSAGDGISAVR